MVWSDNAVLEDSYAHVLYVTYDLFYILVTQLRSYKRPSNLQSSNISCLGFKEFADLYPKMCLQKSLRTSAPNSPAASVG